MIDSVSRASPSFRFSFGDPAGSAAEYLAANDGGAFLNRLAALLASEPHAEYFGAEWPEWLAEDETAAPDLTLVRCVHGEAVASELAASGRYVGLRTAIGEDGAWLYAIAGD